MRLAKAAKAALDPQYWPALARGVVPTIEHRLAFGGIVPGTVIDVGANKGQFAVFARRLWPLANIHAFEPLEGPRRCLQSVTDERTTIHPYALGDHDTTAQIWIASRVDSSSLLPVGENQSQIFGVSSASSTTTKVRRLDHVFTTKDLSSPALLKIDVQGFEFEVLRGVGVLVTCIEWIYVEVSYLELYRGQRLFEDVDSLLTRIGYESRGRYNVHRAPDGAEVQADLLYVRRGRT